MRAVPSSRRVFRALAILLLVVLPLSGAVSAPPVSAQPSQTTVPLSGSPYGLAYDSTNGYLYVSYFGSPNSSIGYVSVINTTTSKIVKNITVGPDYAYLDNSLKEAPMLTDIKYDNTTNRIFVIDRNSLANTTGVWIINPTTESVVGEIDINDSHSFPYWLATANGMLWVTEYGTKGNFTGSALEYNEDTRALVANVTLSGEPGMAAFDPQNGELYVAVETSNATAVIDATAPSPSVVKSIPVTGDPYAVAYGGGDVYVTEIVTDQMAVIQASSNTVAESVSVPQRSETVAYTGDPYVAVFGDEDNVLQVFEVTWSQETLLPTFTLVGTYTPSFEVLTAVLFYKMGYVNYAGILATESGAGGVYSIADVGGPPTTTTTEASSSSETLASATSSTSSESSSTVVSISESSPSTTTSIGVGGFPWTWIGIGVVLLLVVGGGFFFWWNTPDEPPPDGDGEGTDEPCEVELQSSEKESEFDVDVDVSMYWKPPVGLPYYPPKTGEDGHPKGDISQYFEEQIRKRKSWDGEKLGTAIAASDGAAAGGSVDAGAKIWLREGTAFPWNLFNGDQRRLLATVRSEGETKGSVLPLEAAAKGWTKIELDVEAKGGSGAVSAAVLIATRAHASVLDPEAKIFDLITGGLEGLSKLLELFEHTAKVVEDSGGAFSGFVKKMGAELSELGNLITAAQEAVGSAEEVEAAAEAAQEAEEVWSEFKEYLGYEVALGFIVPLLIEHLAEWYFLAAEVEIEGEGEMSYTIGSCEPGSVKAAASMELEFDDGKVKKPKSRIFDSARLSRRIGSCTSSGELNVDIDSEVKVGGKAKDGGEGFATVDSLWAVAWAWCCQGDDGTGDDGGSGSGEPSPVQFDSTFGAWFDIPSTLERKHKGLDSNGIRKLVEDGMTAKLDDLLLQGAQANSLPCPAEDPAAAEEALRNILFEWLTYIQTEYSLFLPGGSGVSSGTPSKGGSPPPGNKGAAPLDGQDEEEGTGTVGDNAEDQNEPEEKSGPPPNPTEQVM